MTVPTDPNAMVEPCYVSPAKEYRKQMAGSFEATELPPPKNDSLGEWQSVASELGNLRERLEKALNKAAEAHEGEASEAAQASIKEILPRLDNAARAANNVKSSLELQVEHQNSTFHELPAPGQKLPNGADMQFDPPEKSWWEDAPVLSWFSDYEERQEAFHATNEKAELIMSGYRAKTEGVVGRLPQFQPEEKPPEERQLPPQSSQPPANSYMANTTMSTPSTPASTRSAWAGGSTLPQTAQMSYTSGKRRTASGASLLVSWIGKFKTTTTASRSTQTTGNSPSRDIQPSAQTKETPQLMVFAPWLSL